MYTYVHRCELTSSVVVLWTKKLYAFVCTYFSSYLLQRSTFVKKASFLPYQILNERKENRSVNRYEFFKISQALYLDFPMMSFSSCFMKSFCFSMTSCVFANSFIRASFLASMRLMFSNSSIFFFWMHSTSSNKCFLFRSNSKRSWRVDSGTTVPMEFIWLSLMLRFLLMYSYL